jgi:hypothetical protein
MRLSHLKITESQIAALAVTDEYMESVYQCVSANQKIESRAAQNSGRCRER